MGKPLTITFDVPSDIRKGLDAGIYKLCDGAVVRRAVGEHKGEIVKFLKNGDFSEITNTAKDVSNNFFSFFNQHKTESIIIASVSAAVAGASVWAWYKHKNHEPEELTNFRKALRIYIDAIRNGDMNLYKIKYLMLTIDRLKKHKKFAKICIQLKAEDLEVLINRLYQYTMELAKANNVDVSKEELNKNTSSQDAGILNLQNYLRTQQKIFENVA